jgi:GDP-4-dehydro-6-deoxy-D-mannose reductase
MVQTLITGATGMIGSHLIEHVQRLSPGTVVGTSFRPTIAVTGIGVSCPLVPLDVRDWPGVRDCIAAYRPEVIYHLAAQSLPTVSWTDPWQTMRTNVEGTVNVFEAVAYVRDTLVPRYDPVVVVACSSAEYGASLTSDRVPVDEEAPLLPLHPYGVSKVAQDLLALQYWRNKRIRCIRARLFNTTGPRKRADVVSDFAARAAHIRREGGMLRVGNIEARRAILDVRDTVAALLLLAERGEPGEAYNVCHDTSWRIGDLIPMLEQLAGVPLPVSVDPALFRPSDEAVILGSSEKLKMRTGWRPRIPIEATLRAVLDYEIARLAGDA